MSDELVSYVKTLKTGDPVSKAVLRALAGRAHSDTGECFPSVKRIAEEVEVSNRTVQRHLTRLEGEGFIERIQRFRDDGSQSSNGFRFPEYEPPLLSWRNPKRPGDDLSPPHDTMAPGGRQSVTGPHDTGVTPYILNEGTTPSSSSDDEAPASVSHAKGRRIPADWAAPSVNELPDTVRALVEQWPDGAYAVTAGTFRDFFESETKAGSRKADWAQAWRVWLRREHSTMVRAKKAGVTFAVPRSDRQAPLPPLAAKARECPRSKAIHERLVNRNVPLGRIAIVVDREALLIVCGSKFEARWTEEKHRHDIEAVARAVLAGGYQRVRYEVELPPAIESPPQKLALLANV